MKKLVSMTHKKKAAVLSSACFIVAALVQACGASNGSSSNIAAAGTSGAAITNAIGVSATHVNGALYEACSSYQAAEQNLVQLGAGSIQINSAVSEAATDGASVCKVSMTQYAPNYQGSRLFLGPAAGLSTGGNTGITLNPFDKLTVSSSGTYTSSSFTYDCGSNSVAGKLYGQVAGLNAFPLDGSVINIPSNGGGYLMVGLNQTPGAGVMCISVSTSITRCVDSSGTPHSCN